MEPQPERQVAIAPGRWRCGGKPGGGGEPGGGVGLRAGAFRGGVFASGYPMDKTDAVQADLAYR